LFDWLGQRLNRFQQRARQGLPVVPMHLPQGEPLFDVPKGLLRILDHDLAAAGLASWVKDERTGRRRVNKRDERGRTVDVHALRTTFGTMLAVAGVSLRVAQEAMRHSDPRLTANVYTDPKFLDVAGAVSQLPTLSPNDVVLLTEAQAAGAQ
jgi:integrase